MINLIKNELLKIFKKKSFYIMVVLLIIFIIINNLLNLQYHEDNKEKYIKTAQKEYEELSKYKDTFEKLGVKTSETEEYYQFIVQQIELDKYIIENKKDVNSQNNNRGILSDIFAQYEIFIIFYIVLISGTMISEEFNKGTIRILLIKPYSRLKIFFAKFITCIIMLIIISIIVVLLQTIIGGIILDFYSLSIPIVRYNATTHIMEYVGLFKYIAIDFLARLPIYIFLLSVAFACSDIFLNGPISIIVPIIIYLFSGVINDYINIKSISLLKFLITLNWNFEPYLFGGKNSFTELSLPFALFICSLYIAIIIIPTAIHFKKKDIKNI